MFYDQLKKVCERKKTSLTSIVLASGMSKSNVTNWKKGQTPTLDTVAKLAASLGVDPRELFPDST